MAASTKISIYVTDENHVPKLVAKGLDKAKLIAFSGFAAEHLSNKAGRVARNSVTLVKAVADADATARIMQWIANNDATNPKPMTLDDLQLECFDEIVAVHYTSNTLFINRDVRGNAVRDAIYDYTKQGALTVEEFATIVERLRFDVGLVKTAKHMVMYGKAKGGLNVPPDMARIESYCRKNGLWAEMCEIEREILSKMGQKNAEDAKALQEKLKKQAS